MIGNQQFILTGYNTGLTAGLPYLISGELFGQESTQTTVPLAPTATTAFHETTIPQIVIEPGVTNVVSTEPSVNTVQDVVSLTNVSEDVQVQVQQV